MDQSVTSQNGIRSKGRSLLTPVLINTNSVIGRKANCVNY